MPQEPWKRASQLQRAVPRESRQPTPQLPQPPSRWPRVVAVTALLLVIGAATMYFLDPIGVSSIMSRVKVATPQSGKGTTESPAEREEPARMPTVTAASLDQGLGIGLAVFGDYRDLLEQTRDRGIEWKLTASGDSIRMTAQGVTVYVTDGSITAYTLSIPQLYDGDTWAWWQRELGDAGLTPETTFEQATGQNSGQSRFTLASTSSREMAEGWGSPAYELNFDAAGVLTEVRAGIELGPSRVPGPPQGSTQPGG